MKTLNVSSFIEPNLWLSIDGTSEIALSSTGSHEAQIQLKHGYFSLIVEKLKQTVKRSNFNHLQPRLYHAKSGFPRETVAQNSLRNFKLIDNA